MFVLLGRAEDKISLMSGLSLWIANLFSLVSPQTRCFGLRRTLYARSGARVHPTAKVNGTARIHYPNASIGAETWVGAGCQLIPTTTAVVQIGDRCDIGPEVMFVTGSHELGDQNRRAGTGLSESITVGNGTWVGARATFTGGASVGEGCMVGAGALVLDQFPDNVMIAGVPARIVRTLD